MCMICVSPYKGTRLGSSDPKGMYNIEFASHWTLFHIQGLRLLRLQQLCLEQFGVATVIPWFVMAIASFFFLSFFPLPFLTPYCVSVFKKCDQLLCQFNMPRYIMTSDPTDEPTKQYFAAHNYFGLAKENVVFFPQDSVPSTDFHGKVNFSSASEAYMRS